MADSKPRKKADSDPDATQARQGAFIAAYGEVGSLRKAAEASRVPRATVISWVQRDTYGFKAKYEASREMFREYLQDIAVQRVKDQGPKDNPVLLITLLNAHWPEKYRRDGNTVTDEVKEMMVEWKKWVRESRNTGKNKPAANEAEEAQRSAVDEVEKLLARKRE